METEEKPDTAKELQARAMRRMNLGIARRGAFVFLASATAFTAIGAGVLVRLIDHRDFETFGDGIWWAIVTLGTVGYGDIVPRTTWGRVVGSVVIVVGVTFIAFLTAAVTSMFVAHDQQLDADERESQRVADEQETRARVAEVLERLESIEKKLDDLAPR
jgi:voltage-gated potassium channel